MHEMRDELFNDKLSNPLFILKSKIDLDGKLVETNMPYKDIEAFDNFLEYIDEHFGEGPVMITEGDIFIKIDEKI